jgi:uncharacterized protein YjbI with pentapeptide repeats
MIEPNVQSLLIEWHNNKIPTGDINTFRRNLVGAILFSSSEHRNLNLKNSTATYMDIRKIKFVDSKLINMQFSHTHWSEIHMDTVQIKDTEFTTSQISGWQVQNSDIEISLTDSKAANLLLKDSDLIIYGRSSLLVNIKAEDCALRISGRIDLQNSSFIGKQLTISHTSETSWDVRNSEFNHISIESQIPGVSSHLSFDNCTFTDCILLGIKISAENISKVSAKRNRFEKCRGFVFVEGTAKDVAYEYDEEFIWASDILILKHSYWKDKSLHFLITFLYEELAVYEIIPNTLDSLKSKKVSKQVINALEALMLKSYKGKKSFVTDLEKRISPDEIEKSLSAILLCTQNLDTKYKEYLSQY